jgi:hypothetical protein
VTIGKKGEKGRKRKEERNEKVETASTTHAKNKNNVKIPEKRKRWALWLAFRGLDRSS